MGQPSIKDLSRIAVIGLWHLGVVASACFADLGYRVTGVDSDTKVVKCLNKAQPPLYEPFLDRLIKRNISRGRLQFTTDVQSGVSHSAFVAIALDTPVDENDNPDMGVIYDTISGCVPHLRDGSTLVVNSQVPVGSCEKLEQMIRKMRPDLRFQISYVPENLKLGDAVARFKHPDMLVIGADTPKALDSTERLYRVINAPKIRTNLRTAEMIKHAINAYLALQVSFANEFGNLCDVLGIDALEVIEGMRLDSRVGQRAILNPGLGFSGGTLARDVKVLRNLAKKFARRTFLLDGVMAVNRLQNKVIIDKLKRTFPTIKQLRVGILGLTYKAGTSSVRRSASLEIIRRLLKEGASVKAFDPKARAEEIPDDLEFDFCRTPLSVAKNADAIILLTPWPEFKELNFSRMRSIMKKPVIVDAQNILDGELLAKIGFVYLGLGRGNTTHGRLPRLASRT